jgi:hypothetical protein
MSGTMSKRELENERFKLIFELADFMAKAEVGAVIPTPMVVYDGGHEWFVADGVCGFAWVTIRPSNCAAAEYAQKELGWKVDDYSDDMRLWVSNYSQSMQRKEVYAHKFAKVLNEHGIQAYSDSQMA